MTKMPPQAYTKEVLATAFDWLSRQNESVKKSIRNSDDLVGLYLRSTRLKEGQKDGQGVSLSSTSSSGYSADLSSAKSFRSELQGLAQNLKQFEEKPALPPELKVEPDYLHELSLMMATQASGGANNYTPATTQGPVNPPAAGGGLNKQQQVASPQEGVALRSSSPSDEQYMATTKENTTANDTADTVLLKLDKKTISAINLAKERLNLSSNTEAIRVLVSLGEKHLKKLFGSED